jgi:metacaspase-1
MKKLALIVGINYPNTPKQLGGCVNDANHILEKLVKEFDFKTSDIQLLIDELATRKNILEGLKYLVKELNAGDIGVFTYSGHGTQTLDLPPINEEDMLDEAIVPIDAIADQQQLIRDDEINEIINELNKEARFVVIFDSCHSQTGTKDLETSPSEETIRSVPITTSVQQVKKMIQDIHNGETSRDVPHPLVGLNHILIAGCKDDQLSYDDGSNGYLTKALVQEMKKGVTYQELFDKVSGIVKELSHGKQEPQIEGPHLDTRIFE